MKKVPHPTKLEDFNYRYKDPEREDYLGALITDTYFQGWESVFQYCHDVKLGIRPASKKEHQVVDRFISDLQRTDIELDLEFFELVLIIANSLKHSKGPISGAYIKLLPWMQFNLFNLFCWMYTDEVEDKTLVGERRFQKVFSFIPRGNAKTQLAAVVAIVSLLTTPNGSPIVTTSASTRKQAAICFQEIASQIENSKKFIKNKFKVRANDVLLKSGGEIIPTSSEAKSIDGLRIVTGILDEIHTHPDSSIHDVIVSGTASSKEPIIYMITTAGTDLNSFCHDMYKYSADILNGDQNNDRFFIQIFESDEEGPNSELGYEQANPSIDHAVSRSTLRSNYLSSLMSESAKAAFMTKHLNRWFQYSENGMLSADLIENAKGLFPTPSAREHTELYVGIDLASLSDLSSLVELYMKELDDGSRQFYARSRSYVPQNAVDATPVNIKGLYTQAINNASLVVSGDIVTDKRPIHEYLDELVNNHEPESIGVDAAAGGVEFSTEHENQYGGSLTGVQQGYGLSTAVNRVIRAFAEGKILIDKNDVMLAWALQNCRLVQGEYGDSKIVRPKNNLSLKIDPAISLAIAFSLVPALNFSTGAVRTLR